MSTLDARLRALEHRVRVAPDDTDAWVELAHLASRSRAALEVLRRDEHLPGLLAAWREVPEDDSLTDLILELLGLTIEPAPSGTIPRFWAGGKGLRGDVERLLDAGTGLPLRCRRRADGALMVLVPEGEVPGMRVNRSAIGESLRAYRTASFLIDPVPVAGEGPGSPALLRSWVSAQTHAHSLGGRLPSFEELKGARGGNTDPDEPGMYAVRWMGHGHPEWTSTFQVSGPDGWELRDLEDAEALARVSETSSRPPLAMTTAQYREAEETLAFRVLIPLTLVRS